jgi:hypothetical protein
MIHNSDDVISFFDPLSLIHSFTSPFLRVVCFIKGALRLVPCILRGLLEPLDAESPSQPQG